MATQKKLNAFLILVIFSGLLLNLACGNYKKAEISEEELAQTTAFAQQFLTLRMEKSEKNYSMLTTGENHILSNKFIERFTPVEGPKLGQLDKAYLEEKLFGNSACAYDTFELGKPITKALGENEDGKLYGTTLGITYRVKIKLKNESEEECGTIHETVLVVKDGERNDQLAIDDFILEEEGRQIN
ncbi:MAG: hypothetical protein A3H98_01710 [Bacteroidetes bacterium RIFCSPLOWO2_02_FULL_36_8]|nr:MAG: hypothetical protein A3H98_01710 [Bacteroidetes bacterium RIFCSPLOWO2_02_FULL_36_8]OFY69371.1 MAG: hypothetical protein A3G23_01045 [Bacteroidetes bacterium RIFCSPLOWO2_12_FULL_37_12]